MFRTEVVVLARKSTDLLVITGASDVSRAARVVHNAFGSDAETLLPGKTYARCVEISAPEEGVRGNQHRSFAAMLDVSLNLLGYFLKSLRGKSDEQELIPTG
jgi:hypothetical protein